MRKSPLGVYPLNFQRTDNCMIKIYDYPYSESHSRNDTDNFIKESVAKYCEQNGVTETTPLFVKRTSLGKPYVEGRRGVHVSVTHAGRILLVAVADREIGLDCESLARKVRDVSALASRFFTPTEKEELQNYTGEQRDTKFLEMWVLKEALVKLSGEGLAAITKTDSMNVPERIETRLIEDYSGYIVALATVKKA